MNNRSLLVLIISFIVGCSIKKTDDQDFNWHYTLESELVNALSLGNFIKIAKNTYFCQYKSEGYLVFENDLDSNISIFYSSGAADHTDEKDILIIDFSKKETVMVGKPNEGKLKIKKCKVEPNLDDVYYIFKRVENSGQGSKTLKIISESRFKTNENQYQNELDTLLGFNPYQLNFHHILEKGVYFENGYHMKVLLSDEHFFLIADDSTELHERTFVHFIREDNSFLNRSFPTVQFDYQNKLNLAKNGIKIKRLKIDNIDAIKKIRFGQYLRKKNYWVQVLNIEQLFQNPLLKFDDDMETDYFKVKSKFVIKGNDKSK